MLETIRNKKTKEAAISKRDVSQFDKTELRIT